MTENPFPDDTEVLVKYPLTPAEKHVATRRGEPRV